MGQFSWDGVVLSKDVKGKGSWRNLRFQSVSGRAEFQSVGELAEELNSSRWKS